MKIPIGATIVGGMSVVATVLLAVAYVSYSTTVQLVEDAGWVEHTQLVKTRLANLLSTLTDAETGSRGYTITGEESFLEPTNAALSRAESEFDTVRKLTADNAEQQARLDRLQPQMEKRLRLVNTLAEIRRSHGLAAVLASGVLGEGKKTHDLIRMQIGELVQAEDRLLLVRKQQTDQTARLNLFVTVAGGIGTLLLFALIVIFIYRAFAERRRAENNMRELNEKLRDTAERARAADHVKSMFLATMSHELRTPLNSIIGFSGVLLQGLAGPLNPEQGKQLEMVRNSGRHLLALINDVLDISKIEAGELKIHCMPFDLRASIDKIVGIVTPLAERKGLSLRTHLTSDLGQAISDERRFEQILLNLLGNAIKFTEHGEVTLTAEGVADFKSTGASNQPAVRLSVADTGMGIKPEDIATLFQPFRQVETGLDRNHEGSGLGLSICRRLADLMGGEVRAESQWGKGSRFIFTLPLKGVA